MDSESVFQVMKTLTLPSLNFNSKIDFSIASKLLFTARLMPSIVWFLSVLYSSVLWSPRWLIQDISKRNSVICLEVPSASGSRLAPEPDPDSNAGLGSTSLVGVVGEGVGDSVGC